MNDLRPLTSGHKTERGSGNVSVTACCKVRFGG